jgi:CheY-like chemotaxis protein
VAKILVADDNSNIQKMVGLALKDQGIDVVAVGNGEAAVRKISDIRPDLVLADVFMPVRNGYEVCQYVKSDSALSHIPVILLVGAFDPLDEQEAQRVGADGVLKKPFVPPDPLISMVKSALARAGVSLTAASATKSAAHAPAAEFSAPAASHVPVATVPEVPASMQSESFAEEIPSRPQELKIDSGAHPPAFGSLLETPVVKEEEDSSLTTQANPVPAMERDWRTAEVEEEVEEEEEEPTSSWRRDAGDEAFADDGTTGPVRDWRDISFAQTAASQPVKEKRDFAQADETQDVSDIEPVPAASQVPAAPEPVSAQSDDQATVPVVSASETAAASEPEKPPAASSWFSVAPSPWEAEAQKASHLASSWDAVAVAPPKETEAEAPAVSGGAPPYADEPLLAEEAEIPAATVEAIREEAAYVAESVTQEASAGDNAAKSPAPETDMEAMVAKVLSKLNPDVLQALTREILKPVIESIVKDELNTKKP